MMQQAFNFDFGFARPLFESAGFAAAKPAVIGMVRLKVGLTSFPGS